MAERERPALTQMSSMLRIRWLIHLYWILLASFEERPCRFSLITACPAWNCKEKNKNCSGILKGTFFLCKTKQDFLHSDNVVRFLRFPSLELQSHHIVAPYPQHKSALCLITRKRPLVNTHTAGKTNLESESGQRGCPGGIWTV